MQGASNITNLNEKDVVDKVTVIENEGSTKYHTNITKAIWTLQNPMSKPLVG